MTYDTIIRGGTVATASDTFQCDVGISGGKDRGAGRHLGDAKEVVDATGKLVLPGGIDSHVHLSQPSGPGIVMADDFASGTRAAAFGGNTMVPAVRHAAEGREPARGGEAVSRRRPTASATSTCRST